MTVDPAWVLAMMVSLEPASPYRETFEATAGALAASADADPLPLGSDRERRTAAVLVAVAWFESRFQPDARGDCDKGTGPTCERPRSLCLLQIGESNLKALGVTKNDLVSDVTLCTRTGLRLMHVSFRVCGSRPLDERLDHYAAGGPTCTPPRRQEGQHRMRLARYLMRKFTP